MDKADTDIMFEHTRRLRKGGKKLLEAPKKGKKEFVFTRPRNSSRRDIRLLEVQR